MGHNAIRYGDEYQCSKCGKSWEIDDPDEPSCTESVEVDDSVTIE